MFVFANDVMAQEIKVLIISGKEYGDKDFRQLPNYENYLVRGNRKYRFYWNSIDGDPDIVVVRNKYVKQKLTFNIAPENTILMLSEPLSVVSFSKRYCNQFGMLHSCQPQMSHRNIVYGPALLPWFVGRNCAAAINYDTLTSQPLPQKTKLLSVITSNKAFTRGHQRRLDFVMKLKQHFGDKIDIYGRGFNTFDDKWDVLKDYKYHIAIENCSTLYYWTEKLSDCFLAGCYPIYYGCKNVGDYFPEKSLATIDIANPDEAIAQIEAILKADEYENKVPYINESKQLVLNKYNMFNLIADCCDTLDLSKPRQKVVLKPASSWIDLRKIYQHLVERNVLNFINFFNTTIQTSTAESL